MKKVFSNPQDVAHKWANKTQDSAKNAGHNFYFEGDTIFSYGRHFPIAKHFGGLVLFTLRTYSVTTSSHISMVRSAASHLPKLYCYDIPNSAKDISAHENNFELWAQNVRENVKKLKNARKPEIYVSAIESNIAEVNKYTEFFNLKLSKEHKEVFTLKDKDKYKKLLAIEAKKKELFEKNILSKGSLLFKQSVQAWKGYTEASFRKGLTDRNKALLNAYLRLQNDNTTILRSNGSEVETSKGIKLPVNVAKRYYNWFKKVSANGGCEDCGYKILDYNVKQANKDHLVVGCHDITVNEIQSLAARLKW